MVDAAGGLVFVGLEFDVDCLFPFDKLGRDLVFFIHKTILIPLADIVYFGKLCIIYENCHITNTIFVAPIADTESKIVAVASVHLVGEESTIGGLESWLGIEVADT